MSARDDEIRRVVAELDAHMAAVEASVAAKLGACLLVVGALLAGTLVYPALVYRVQPFPLAPLAAGQTATVTSRALPSNARTAVGSRMATRSPRARSTRWGSRHAQASAYGPPPEPPATQNRGS